MCLPSREKESSARPTAKMIPAATLEGKNCFVRGSKGLGSRLNLEAIPVIQGADTRGDYAADTLVEWVLPLGKAEEDGEVQTEP